jgi:2-phosphosulfolactate phosphatase
MKTLDVFFTPAEFATLPRRNLDDTFCVVFDIFRATTTMITALANGATAILPAAEIPDALAFRRQDPTVLLAGERDGLRIRANLTGGVEFDLGNSPREFTSERVSGRTIVMTTTNGTRALRACAHAREVLVGSFLNLRATADRIRREHPDQLLLVCSGTFEQAAYEDVLAAGALCELLGRGSPADEVSDSVLMVRRLFRGAGEDLIKAASASRNGRRLLAVPELNEDVRYCLRLDTVDRAAALNDDGQVKLIAG